jgi:hypothetical protein
MLKWLAAGWLALLLAAQASPVALAIPLFAHQYGVTCAKCHSVIPHLNEFGAAFLAYGERFPGVSSGPVAVPLSVKTNIVDSSEYQGNGPNGEGLPKFIVDEIEAFTTATIGSRANFFVEQYVLDGGEPGLLRDAWVNDRINPWTARIPIYLQGGQFTLPLPVDPETFRDSYQNYAPYVQTVGRNPFDFFDPAMGMRLGVGDPLHGASLQLFGGPGYTRESDLAVTGVDTDVYAQDAMGPFTLSLFRYDGLRPVDGEPFDRFERMGYGFTYGQWTRFSSEFVLTEGWDSNCGVPRITGCSSSGGFEQLRYMFNERLFAEARYEGTADSTGVFTRDGVVLMGYGPTENTRLTVEDVIAHVPQTTNTMNAQFSIGY